MERNGWNFMPFGKKQHANKSLPTQLHRWIQPRFSPVDPMEQWARMSVTIQYIENIDTLNLKGSFKTTRNI